MISLTKSTLRKDAICMEALFSHVDGVKYILTQLFESGFLLERDIENELIGLSSAAKEIGLAKGAGLLETLAAALMTFRGLTDGNEKLMPTYSDTWAYYELVLKILIVHSITEKQTNTQ